MKILAIESSCDETAAAVLTEENGKPKLLSNIVSSQIDIHKEFGGVVPEVAARAHIENIVPVIKEALAGANITLDDLTHIAATKGPGLIGSLVVGVETVKAIALAKKLPVIPLNHLEGHIYANFIEGEPKFPLLALLVSGGHTMLIYMNDHLNYEVIGQTWDDAAGEAFDKGAKIMGLGYPGGPIISKLAKEGDRDAYNFPIIDLTPKPQRNEEGFLVNPEPSLDFSFSGLKTALLTQVKKLTADGRKLTKKETTDLSASFEKAIVDTLVQNSLRAAKKYQPKTFILSGGVAANPLLRQTLAEAIKSELPQTEYLIPDINYCTDNAAMIASAAYYHLKYDSKPDIDPDFVAEPNLKLK